MSNERLTNGPESASAALTRVAAQLDEAADLLRQIAEEMRGDDAMDEPSRPQLTHRPDEKLK